MPPFIRVAAALLFAISTQGNTHAAPLPLATPTPATPENVGAHEVVTMKIGIEVAHITNLDLSRGTFTTEFYAHVQCDKEPCKPDLVLTAGTLIGPAEVVSDDPLSKVIRIKAEQDFVVDLAEYPFDTHQLAIMLEQRENPETVKFVADPGPTKISEGVRVPGWVLSKGPIEVNEDDIGGGQKISVLDFQIDMTRPSTSSIFKSIVPLVTIIFVTAFSLLLKPKSAGSRLAAATGSLMTVVMFQVGQLGSLPPIGYLTRLDKFMLATYIVYLFNIGFAVAMVRFDEAKNDAMAERMYLMAARVVPAVAAIGWLCVILKLV